MAALPWETLILAVGLGAARTMPVTWLVPALGGPRLPPQMRVGLGLLLAVLCLPVLAPAAGRGAAMSVLATGGGAGWVILLARELMVGTTVGLCAGAVFSAAEAAGRLVDVARGTNAVELLAAGGDARSSPTGDLYVFVATILFLELGGLRVMASALVRSYEAVPVGAPPAAEALRSAAELVLLATARLLESAVVFAAPVLVAMALADVVLGVVGRVSPQVPLYFAALPAKALLGLGLVLIGLGALDAAWAAGFPSWMALVERAVSSWR